MENLKKIVLATAIVATAASCSKEEEIVKETSRINIENFELGIAEGDTTLTFYAANDWTASLSSTSWIALDEMTKLGEKGDSEIILNWQVNHTTKARETYLTIAVVGEDAKRIKIQQHPSGPFITFSEEKLDLKAQLIKEKNAFSFVDTLTIKSNIKWVPKAAPAWAIYEQVDINQTPQEGVYTEIDIVVKAKTLKLDEIVATGEYLFGSEKDAEHDIALPVTAETVLSYTTSEGAENPKEMTLELNSALGDVYAATMDLESNTKWEILNMPEWLEVSATTNGHLFEGAKEDVTFMTNRPLSFVVPHEKLTTGAKTHTVKFVNTNTGLERDLTLNFPGVGENYYYAKWELPPDFKFSSSAYTENWEPVEDAQLAYQFDVLTDKPFDNIFDAPFDVFFLKTNGYGQISSEEVFWAGLDVAAPIARNPISGVRVELYVQDRNQGMEQNKFIDRHAAMIIVDKGVQYDDLFEPGTDVLKEEYYYAAKSFTQHAVVRTEIDVQIPDLIEASASGFTESYGAEGAMYASVRPKTDGEQIDWVSFTMLPEGEGAITEVKVEVDPNTTGKVRTGVFIFTVYDPSSDSEKILKEFTITQAAQ